MVPQRVSGVVKVLLEAGADPNLTGMVPQRVSGGGEGAAGGWSQSLPHRYGSTEGVWRW